MLSKVTNQPKSTIELGYMCPGGLSGPPAVTLIKYLKYKKKLPLKRIRHLKSSYQPSLLSFVAGVSSVVV